MTQNIENYQIAILGGGPAGYVAAIRAAQLGKTVCVIEKEEVGGTCLLHGCIPTKALLASSDLLHKIAHARDFGLILEGSIKPDPLLLFQRKDNIVSILSNGIKSLFRSHQIPLFYGQGVIKNSRTLEVTPSQGYPKLIQAENIIICTGSRPMILPGFPFDGTKILSTTDALKSKEIPPSLIILGAGSSGCEFAFLFSELGSEVIVIEMQPHILPNYDEEIAELLERQFRKHKIRLLTQCKILNLETVDEHTLRAHLDRGESVHAEKLLVTVGRVLNTHDFGIEELDLRLGPKGEIPVNDRMETSVPGIYAAGDVTGIMLLAHVASAQAIVAVENICGIPSTMNYDLIPWITYTHPPVAWIGLTEQQCIQRKKKFKIGRFNFRGLGAAQITNELDGMVKIIAEEKTDALLGVHIIGPNAGELIHIAAAAFQGKLTAKQFSSFIYAHPSLAESILEALKDVHGEAIHLPGKTDKK